MVRRTGFTLMWLLFAGAASSLAQAPAFTLAVDPVQPRVGQPVRVTATFHSFFGCYRQRGEVVSGTTIDLHTEDCLIATPPPTLPGTVDSWELGELPAGTYTVRFVFLDFVLEQMTFQVLACAPGTLCFQQGRFEVGADWAVDISSFGTATPSQLTADTGYFWFFQPENVELLVKVLDGCSVNGHFWVFAAGLTDVQTRITVTDTLLDTTHAFTNNRGTPFAPIQSTSLFPCE
jgi:hypothetical protein